MDGLAVNLGRYRKTIAALRAGPRMGHWKTHQVARKCYGAAATVRLTPAAGLAHWLHHLRDAFHEDRFSSSLPCGSGAGLPAGIGASPLSCGGQEVCGGHSAGWRRALGDTGALPEEIPALLALADGVLLTGSPSNVHPSHFGEEVLDPSLPLDPDRDNFTLPMIRQALERVCPCWAFAGGSGSECGVGWHAAPSRAPTAGLDGPSW